MKLELDEKIKHRLIGIVVIMSMVIVFAPAMMKKSNQQLEHKLTMNIKLPIKPSRPEIVKKDKKEIFQTVQTARVELPSVPVKPFLKLAKATTLDKTSHLESRVSQIERSKKMTLTDKAGKEKLLSKAAKVKPAQYQHKEAYSIQLASFSKIANAQNLMRQLKRKGYHAKMINVKGSKYQFYKVYAGREKNKSEAEQLKQRLAAAFHLKDLIIVTGVS